ncbi:hypothetical protein CesoFtcFv8_025851 [Champsocephalus esox]|uniref:Uncharacterized protein n=1 Tax=Champsocephalus esox TaxID=159716 RepID=A0AAN8GAV3_9TELE|nr:hypothetical protein CesoFtcFv8_025851 [Champsocephalus esox]
MLNFHHGKVMQLMPLSLSQQRHDHPPSYPHPHIHSRLLPLSLPQQSHDHPLSHPHPHIYQRLLPLS